MVEFAAADGSIKEKTFTTFATDFKLDPKVLVLLLASPMDNLEDLRFYFTVETDIDGFISQDDNIKGPDLKLQVSRLRRAWSAVRQTALQKESRNSTSTVAELDDLLCETDLRNVKIQFWKRYKLRYPADIMPCDHVISRCFRD